MPKKSPPKKWVEVLKHISAHGRPQPPGSKVCLHTHAADALVHQKKAKFCDPPDDSKPQPPTKAPSPREHAEKPAVKPKRKRASKKPPAESAS